jgi:hypothetical protein
LDAAQDPFCFSGRGEPHVDGAFGVLGDHVGGRAAAHGTDVHGGAVVGCVQSLQPLDLPCDLKYRACSFFGLQAGVGRLALRFQSEHSGALAAGLHAPAR